MVRHKALRKACDVCYRKRIRCDAQKPRCSHCVLYDSACTFQAPSRKATVPANKHGTGEDDMDALQARVKRLESSLGRAQRRIDELESLGPQSNNIPNAVSTFPELYLTDITKTRPGGAPLELPPRPEVSSAVKKYLRTMNTVLPLFHPEKLLQRIQTWFEHRIDQRDCTTWAAVNVVLALAHRQTPSDETTPNKSVAHFLNCAQSVLNEVIMSKANLLNVQVLVGMVMLFQGTLDLKPAAMLIAVALRLAHELGLHTGSNNPEHLDPAVRLERDRVFWIAYVLDRDISIRTRQPPVQHQVDIGIEWPSDEPSDEAGLVTGFDGCSRFNFLLARVKLAHIQGEVYEIMYSTRAQTMDSYERLENMTRLRLMLDDWLSWVPRQFRPNAILQASDPGLCRAFGILYSSHLACRTLVCQAHIMESTWLQRLQDFGRESARGEVIVLVPPLPQGWKELVCESREYMRLFMSIEWKDPAFIWMTVCTYISGSVCLTANSMFNPRHDSAEDDRYLADLCFSFLEDMIHQVPFEPLQRTRNAYEELLRYDRAASLQAITQETSCLESL